MRAIAALSVCLFHFICTVKGFINNEVIRQIFSVGHYGVQIFFVISGFIIPWSMFHSSYVIRNYFTFIFKRFIRLEPPYIVSLFAAIAITHLRTLSPHFNNVDTTPTAKQIALHFGYLIPFFKGQEWIRAIYWTLAIEFQYYLSIGLMFGLIANHRLVWRILAYLIILCGPFLINDFLLYHFPVFLLGILIFLFKVAIIERTEFIVMTVLTTAIVFTFHGTGTLAASGIAFGSILFFTNFNNKLFQFLGDISYSMYLFHSIIGLVIINYFSHSIQAPLFKFLLVIVALFASIITSFVVFKCIELPSKKLSSKIKFKQNR